MAAVMPLLAVTAGVYCFYLFAKLGHGPPRMDVFVVVFLSTVITCLALPVLLASLIPGVFTTGFIEEFERQGGVSTRGFWVITAASYASMLVLALFVRLMS